MLTQIEGKDIPAYGKGNRSPIRQFAYKTVIEFLENSKVGDVFEVTGFPAIKGNDKLRMAEKVAQAMRTELFYLYKDHDARDDAKIFRRRERLFIERVKRFTPQIRNPHHKNLPVVH